MGNKQNSIVLNGKLYDARTGALIHAPHTTPKPKVKIRKNKGLVMDSVTSPKRRHTPPAPVHHQVHHAPAHTARHKPQRAHTLMRSVVSKPKPTRHKTSTNLHNERTNKRLERAQAVPKSHHIQRFPASHATQQSATKTLAPITVHADPKPPHHVAPVVAPKPVSESERLVTNALRHATAHEANHPFAKKPKRRLSHKLGFKRHTANIAMGGLAILLLAGFFAYQNIPSLSMQVASTRAGFNAEQPDYKPSGFTQNSLVTYSPGKVTISFHSNSDDRQFQLTQQVSNWNSQALASNYLAVNNKDYQTYQAGGKTVYIYDDDNATWVNGGVWYQIEGESSLTSEQLLKIANSI